MSTTDADVAHVRSFNRVVTQRIGALNDRYLGSGRPLGQDRLLWEIGVTGCEVRSLRARLGIDAGHASRLLRALEAAQLIVVTPDEGARAQPAPATPPTPPPKPVWQQWWDYFFG